MSDQPDAAQVTPKVIGDDDQGPKTVDEKEQAQATKDLSGQKNADQLSMDIKVASPFNTYFEGTAFSITGENETGVFDILPKHHNFISLLKPCTLIVRTVEGEDQKIDISGGLMHVKADKVIVFLDI